MYCEIRNIFCVFLRLFETISDCRLKAGMAVCLRLIYCLSSASARFSQMFRNFYQNIRCPVDLFQGVVRSGRKAETAEGLFPGQSHRLQHMGGLQGAG